MARYKVPAGTSATYYNCPTKPELEEWIIGATTQDAYFDHRDIPMMNDALTDGTIVFRLPRRKLDKGIINNFRYWWHSIVYRPSIRVNRADCILLETHDGILESQLNNTAVVGKNWTPKDG